MFTSPIGLLALLGIPAVVALHLFRRRFRPQEVSALFLWMPRDRTSLSGRKRERLRTSASFWLELLAALVAGLAFAGPRSCSDTTSQHLVCVLDDSASMLAIVDGEALRDEAKQRVEQRIANLPSNSRVTLIATGTPPRVLAGPAAFPDEARAYLADFEPTAPSHSALPALALAERIVGEGSLWLVTDRLESDGYPANLEISAFGKPTANLAIVDASRIAIDEAAASERVLLTIQNFALSRVNSHVTIRTESTILAKREFDLQPGERSFLAFDLSAGVETVFAELPDDGLQLDNTATLVQRPPRTLAIYSNLSPEVSARLGLSSGKNESNLDAFLRIVPESFEAPSASAAHILFSDSVAAPAGSQATWSLTLDAGDDPERQDLIGPFLVDRGHPLLQGVTLDGIIWSRNPKQQPPGSPLVSAGNEVLLAEQLTSTRRLFFANFEATRSSLQRSPDWPILLANLVDMRRAELPGARSTNLSSGEEFLWVGAKEAEFVITGPNTRLEKSAKGTLVIADTLAPGLYSLDSQGKRLCQFGVTFADASESDLRQLSRGERKANQELASVDSGTPALQLALIAAMLAFLLGDWFVLSRGTLGPAEDAT